MALAKVDFKHTALLLLAHANPVASSSSSFAEKYRLVEPGELLGTASPHCWLWAALARWTGRVGTLGEEQ